MLAWFAPLMDAAARLIRQGATTRRLLRFACAAALAIAACRPSAAPPDAAQDVVDAPGPPRRPLRLGAVDGSPWIAGGPPNNPTWPCLLDLDARHELVTLQLDEHDAEVDVLFVPLLSALSQPQLDVLRSRVESGTPALVVVDPLPMTALDAAPVGQGNARKPANYHAFLRWIGVTWRDDQVLGATDDAAIPTALNRQVLRTVAASGDTLPGVDHVAIAFGGFITAMPNADFEPLLLAKATSDLTSADEHLVFHPFFGPSLAHFGSSDSEDEPPRGAPVGAPAVVAARVTAMSNSPNAGNVVVVADLDAFRLRAPSPEPHHIDTPPVDNQRLLPAIIEDLAGTGHPARPVGSPDRLLSATAKVTTIDVVDRAWPSADELEKEYAGDHERARKALRWLRLRRSREWRASAPLGADDEQMQDRFVAPERVDALLAALRDAQPQPIDTPLALRDPARDEESTTVRVIARAADGTPLVDILLHEAADPYSELRSIRDRRSGGDYRIALPLHVSADLAALGGPSGRAESWPPPEPRRVPVSLGLRAAEVERVRYRSHRLDFDVGELHEARDLEFVRDGGGLLRATTGTANARAVQTWLEALVSLELLPDPRARRPREFHIVDGQSKGIFVVARDSSLIGEVGEVEITTSGRTIRVLFGSEVRPTWLAPTEPPRRYVWLAAEPPFSGPVQDYWSTISGEAFAAVHPDPASLEARP
ncbi:MAG: hypothetical protein AAF721_07820 [Myxococcota bacterium]